MSVLYRAFLGTNPRGSTSLVLLEQETKRRERIQNLAAAALSTDAVTAERKTELLNDIQMLSFEDGTRSTTVTGEEDQVDPKGFLGIETLTNFTATAAAIGTTWKAMDSIDFWAWETAMSGDWLLLWLVLLASAALATLSWKAVEADKRQPFPMLVVGLLNAGGLLAAVKGITFTLSGS